jgi:hypothetical protein|tara:strand:- start:23 stop:190 length:168 start_codon:yes stop_codon:yes gene_type:complete
MDNNLTDCIKELRVARNKQYDADFEDRVEDAAFYKVKADHFQKLVDQGVEFEPLF